MKTPAAFASLATGAMTSVAVFTANTAAVFTALVLIGSLLALEVSYLVLYVRRPADRKDLLKLYRVWRGR